MDDIILVSFIEFVGFCVTVSQAGPEMYGVRISACEFITFPRRVTPADTQSRGKRPLVSNGPQ